MKDKTAAAYGHLGGQIGGAVGGTASTTAKRGAARENGKLGGRPRRKLPCHKDGTLTEKRDASRRPDCGC